MRRVDDGQKWDNSTSFVTDDEQDYLLKLIKNYKLKRSGFKPEELLRMAPSMIKKSYCTIEAIYREILSEAYWRIEYDKMRVNDPYVCTQPPRGFTTQALKILTLENLLERIGSLKSFRKEIKTFLDLIH